MHVHNSPHHHEAVVIGAGQAGLATAFYLLRAGVDTLVLDDQPAPGGAWRHVWPSLRLFSTAGFSNLPGTPMPSYGGYPPASHVVDYLTAYERRYRIPVQRPVRVARVEHQDGTFRIDAESLSRPGAGTRSWTATTVVATTGTWSAPFVPSYPGKYTGTQWHSANYPGPEPFRGSTVAVVGAANSAAQIAAELTEDPDVGEVNWYTRHPPRWMPDDVDGRTLFRRNRERAAAITRGESDPGADSALGDIVVLPQVRVARDTGDLEATPMFSSLNEVEADQLIWCTGFRPALGPVRHLVADGSPQVPGLLLVGYGDWTGPGSATITGVGPFAKAAARQAAERVGKTVR
ncbi:FAD-dependent oxidoreductase [Corynebacterium glyciniphilum]|uniref:FAD-dependent oxidoreductase n=1 Tax=Corynebacterium glyciniphilum TaxID=1404244 RepID=UPI003FD349FF